MFIMIHAYLDESGQQDNDYVVIAGHIGYTSQWSRFVDCWNGALGEQRKRLHMNSLRWSNHSTERLLKRLGPIPVECGLKRLIGGVRVSDYEDLVVGPKAKAAMKGYACSVLSVGVSLLLCDVPDGERFELVFEQQDRYITHAAVALSTLSNDPNPLLRTKDGQSKLAKWSFASSTMIFDQADFLCYALFHALKDPTSQKAKWCKPILEGGQTIGHIMSKEEIREAVMNEPYPGYNLI